MNAIIADALRDGYGLEDIAVRHGTSEAGVRRLVRTWRRAGLIESVLREGAAALERESDEGLA